MMSEECDTDEDEMTQIDYEFYNCVDGGPMASIKKYLDDGANIHFDNDFGIVAAVECNRLDLVDFLMARGADIHARDHACIRHASRSGNFPMVKKLVEHGANFRTHNDFALYFALIHSRMELASYLMDLGCEYRPSWNDRLEPETLQFVQDYKPLAIKAASKTE